MSDSTATPSNPDNARLEKLERTVRRLRRWLWVALIIGIAFFSFAIGRISGSKAQMNRDHGMPGKATKCKALTSICKDLLPNKCNVAARRVTARAKARAKTKTTTTEFLSKISHFHTTKSI
ncbi:MAG: hypothetical protein NTY97_05765 [Planctomycetota bacterium]|nr:hypothetical protein [Planctomycetota bacterium]